MARSFNNATPDGLTTSDTRFNLTGDLTVAATVNYTAAGRLVSHWGTTNADAQWLLEITGGDKAQFARQGGGGTFKLGLGATTLSTGTLYRVMGRANATNGAEVLVNGVSDGVDAGALTAVSTAHACRVGMDPDGTGGISANLVAEVAVWSVSLTDDEALAYARGISALLIRPTALVEYLRISGRQSPELGARGSSWTLVGSPAFADHPRVYMPTRPIHPPKTLVAVVDEARSGVGHSGNFHSGDFIQSFAIAIAGTDRTRKVWSRESQIEDLQGGDPNTMTGTARGFDITEGQEIKAYNGGIDVGVPYFCGHILEVSPTSSRKVDRVRYQFVATDYTWLLDQPSKVTGYYRDIGVNTLVRKLITDFAPSGFSGGYLPSSLGDLDEMQFTNETFSDAMTRIADRVDGGALWSCDYRKVLSMWPLDEEDPHVSGNALTVVDAGSHRTPKYRIDVKQIRTRVIVDGGGSATTSQTSANATVIAVEECGWYRSSGGTFRAAQAIGAYTGKSTETGPGTLTGVTWTSGARDIPQGEVIVLRATANDAAAQTALAALIGGTGVAVHTVSDGRLSLDECENRATSELALYSAQIREFGYAIDDDVHTVSGRNVTVNVTKPATVNTVLRAQRVIIRKRSRVAGSTVGLERVVTLAPVRVDLANVLERVE